jgi:hypothetical protein
MASGLGLVQPIVAAGIGQMCLACDGDCSRCGGERTIWVDQVNGSDSHSGLAKSDALQTISAGAAIIQGGDVMIVRPGTYYETPVFRDLGSSEDAPVWILAETPGAAVISGLWPEAERGTVPWTNIGQNIYATPHGDAFMGDVADRFLFRYKSLADLEATSVLNIQKPDYGFAHEGDRIYLRLPHGADPAGIPIRLTDKFSQTIVTIENSPYVILDGFAITGAGGTEAIQVDRSSDHVTLRNLLVTHSRLAARLPDDSLFEWSEYSYPGFYNFVDDLIDLNEGRTDEGNNYAIYDLVKKYFSKNGNAWLEGGLAESFDVPSDNAEFRYIYTHEIFDGQRLGAFINSSSHHNVCNYAYDDCIEFEHWSHTHPSTNLEVHDSLLMNAMGSAISHQDASGNMQGPHYVYRNVIYNTDYKHAHPAFLVKNRSLTAVDKIVYHHNLMQNWQGTNKGWGKTNWLFWDNKKGTPEHLTFRNNIILFDQLTDKNDQNKPNSDYNILVNARDSEGVRGRGGKYLGNSLAAVRFRNETGLDFGLEEGSPAIDAGEPLPADWPDSRTISDRPDIGPFEFGENPGPDWPRPRTTAFTTARPDRWR